MGKERRERKAQERLSDVPRKVQVLRGQVERLQASMARNERRVDEMTAQAPPNPSCCRTYWLVAHFHDYTALTDTCDRQERELRRLRSKLQQLLPPRPETPGHAPVP